MIFAYIFHNGDLFIIDIQVHKELRVIRVSVSRTSIKQRRPPKLANHKTLYE